MAAVSQSLLEPTGVPVLKNSVSWISDLLTGTLAVGLCVLAVAIIGFLLLSGRLAIRQGVRVILGCFILFSARLIAQSISGLWQTDQRPLQETVAAVPPDLAPREELPPADYDPYAGASIRRD